MTFLLEFILNKMIGFSHEKIEVSRSNLSKVIGRIGPRKTKNIIFRQMRAIMTGNSKNKTKLLKMQAPTVTCGRHDISGFTNMENCVFH